MSLRSSASAVPPLADLGTANPQALLSPVLSRRSAYAGFDAAAHLAGALAALKSEHEGLTAQLRALLSGPAQTRFTRFEAAEAAFAARLLRREEEIESFGKVLNRYRACARPTFVEVDASIVRGRPREGYDLVHASLLVSNEQRGFFAKGDIERQNAELRALVHEQEEALRLLTARLRLFAAVQNATAARFTVNSLRSGRAPAALAAETPTVEAELRTKLRVLAGELAQLVGERRRLAGARVARKLARRRAAGGEPRAQAFRRGAVGRAEEQAGAADGPRADPESQGNGQAGAAERRPEEARADADSPGNGQTSAREDPPEEGADPAVDAPENDQSSATEHPPEEDADPTVDSPENDQSSAREDPPAGQEGGGEEVLE
jgi:hypothetical protein